MTLKLNLGYNLEIQTCLNIGSTERSPYWLSKSLGLQQGRVVSTITQLEEYL